MTAKSPREICPFFQKAMAAGDVDAVLSLYDAQAIFVMRSGEVTKDRSELRRELTHVAAAKPRFDYTVEQVAETDGIALMHTQWTVSGAEPMQVHAIEIARRQPDGTWRWLIGDPFTVGRE